MQLGENRSHCRGVPDDAVLHLASDTLLPGPCHLGTRVWGIGRHSHPDISTSGSSRGKPYTRNYREGGKLRAPSCLSKTTVHPHLEDFVQLWSLNSQEIIKGLGRAMASGSEMPPCPSMLPRAEGQLRNVSPFSMGTLMWWHRAGYCSSPCSRNSKTSCEERCKCPFLMRCCSSTHLIFADLPVRKPLMTALK